MEPMTKAEPIPRSSDDRLHGCPAQELVDGVEKLFEKREALLEIREVRKEVLMLIDIADFQQRDCSTEIRDLTIKKGERK
jgi:hypothetical protein